LPGLVRPAASAPHAAGRRAAPGEDAGDGAGLPTPAQAGHPDGWHGHGRTASPESVTVPDFASVQFSGVFVGWA